MNNLERARLTNPSLFFNDAQRAATGRRCFGLTREMFRVKSCRMFGFIAGHVERLEDWG